MSKDQKKKVQEKKLEVNQQVQELIQQNQELKNELMEKNLMESMTNEAEFRLSLLKQLNLLNQGISSIAQQFNHLNLSNIKEETPKEEKE